MNDPSASRWLATDDGLRRVRVAPRRNERPSDYEAPRDARCPFCLGAEADTPPELDRIGAGQGEHDGDGGWLARVVPNRYPAFEAPDGEHEVIVESPRHTERFTDLTPAEATAAVRMWARRLAHWRDTPRYGYQLVFKNEGPAAGASLAHTHTQVVALPDRPTTPQPTLPAGELVVLESVGFVVGAATAPRFAYETTVYAADATHDFASLADDTTAASDLATLLRATITAVRSASGVDAYNLMVHLTPDGDSAWRIDIAPRSAVAAGFELATGLWINTTPPETAAERVRAAWPNGVATGHTNRA
ncbi:MAG: DUF4931 domain-containing protein [Planctomycetota bacterium]